MNRKPRQPKSHPRKSTRRRFIANSAALLAAPTIVPASVFGANAPSNRITCGVIGAGTRGLLHTNTLIRMDGAQLVAVCDTFQSKADKAKAIADKWYANKEKASVTAYQDFRDVIARPDIDAVFVAAPENWHGVIGSMAAQAGKDVYGEKSLTHTISEGRDLINVVRREETVFQSGTQQRSDPKFRKACELAINGYLGEIRKVHVGVPGGAGKAKEGIWPAVPVPQDLNYDLWLGPAQTAPYLEDMCTFNWYFMSAYCAGWIVSWGVHHLDIALWGMPEFQTGRIEVGGSAEFFDASADVSYAWDVNFTTPSGLQMHFVDSAKSHGQGVRFIGDKGWVHVNRGKITASDPALLSLDFKDSDQRLQESIHHHDDFLQSVKSRKDPVAPIEACHRATTLGLIADTATRLNRKLTWDWDREQFIDDAVANSMLSRLLRSPWKVR